MKITAIVYDAISASPISTTEINCGHLGVIDYFVKSLYPEEQGLCVRLGTTQVNIEHKYVGYFTDYEVTIETEDTATPCERLYFETATEVNEFLGEYLGNIVETERAIQAWY